MTRLTPQLIEKAPQFTNSLRERELDLQYNAIDLIENLGVTKDVFDTISLSNNRIKRLEGIPLLERLTSLHLSNNHINYISENIGQSLPNLENLCLSKNSIQDFKTIDQLCSLPKLTRLALLQNPIATKANYRHYLIYKLPWLKVLDFQKITPDERQAADQWVESDEGSDFLKMLSTDALHTSVSTSMLSEDEKQKLRAEIGQADSLEQISQLKIKLQSASFNHDS